MSHTVLLTCIQRHSHTYCGRSRHPSWHKLVESLQGIVNGKTVGKPDRHKHFTVIHLFRLVISMQRRQWNTDFVVVLPGHDSCMCSAVHLTCQEKRMAPKPVLHSRLKSILRGSQWSVSQFLYKYLNVLYYIFKHFCFWIVLRKAKVCIFNKLLPPYRSWA